MEHSLNAQAKLDVGSDVIRIDVRGSLSQQTRPALVQLIQRARRMGMTSHIRVDLANAEYIESSALAGLRHDLNSVDLSDLDVQFHAASRATLPAAAGVSLELMAYGDDFGRVFEPVDLAGDFTASIDASGTGPLTRYSDDELLAASDCVFGRLDDPQGGAKSELLARYDDISLELSRRQHSREPEPV
ncbi:hypothetical protein ACTWLI_04265 [Arthrobacter sp. Hor0625]|uniref:hypothetical protein n=1 Tax=Arthrobacter sp. Hor0625 TaxID=3457358 RepID=UPI00403E4D5F